MIPGHKHLVFEEGLQSAWLYETLRPHVDEIVVAGITTRRGPKSDERNAYTLALAEKPRVGELRLALRSYGREFRRKRPITTRRIAASERVLSLGRQATQCARVQ